MITTMLIVTNSVQPAINMCLAIAGTAVLIMGLALMHDVMKGE